MAVTGNQTGLFQALYSTSPSQSRSHAESWLSYRFHRKKPSLVHKLLQALGEGLLLIPDATSLRALSKTRTEGLCQACAQARHWQPREEQQVGQQLGPQQTRISQSFSP